MDGWMDGLSESEEAATTFATFAMLLPIGVYGRSALDEAATTIATFAMPLAVAVLDLHVYEECGV